MYLYRCDDCNYEFEKLVPSYTDDQAPCPKCGKPSDKQPTACGFQWGKGGHWNKGA